MPTHTDSDIVVADAIIAIITANQTELAIDDILYGDHKMLPHASAAVIQAIGINRTLVGAAAPGGRTDNNLLVLIDLHWSRVGDEATQRRIVDERANLLAQKIHVDTTLGGIIIHGYVQSIERGVSILNANSEFRSCRLNYIGKTRTYLSPPAAP